MQTATQPCSSAIQRWCVRALLCAATVSALPCESFTSLCVPAEAVLAFCAPSYRSLTPRRYARMLPAWASAALPNECLAWQYLFATLSLNSESDSEGLRLLGLGHNSQALHVPRPQHEERYCLFWARTTTGRDTMQR